MTLDFSGYLRSVCRHYAQWWKCYTLTDAVGKERVSEKVEQLASPFDFGLMVQTVGEKAERREAENGRAGEQEKEKIERLPVLRGIRKYAAQHVLLRGRPGSGKSTALIRLLLEDAEAATQSTDSRSPIPILVELRYWSESVINRIQSFIHQHDPTLALDQLTLSTLLRQGKFLLLIDGLNELPSEAARQDVMRFRKDYLQTAMIFTTRELSTGGDFGIAKQLEMQPLTEIQMRQFVQAYLPQDQAEQLLRQLKDRLRELGQTPLLLWMLCGLFQQTGMIPPNLGMVFRCFTQGYERNLKQDVPIQSDRRNWARVLQRLAFIMLQGKDPIEKPTEFLVAINRSQAERALVELFTNEVPFPRVFVQNMLEDLLNYHLIQLNGDKIEFRHQLLQEYYAAEALLQILPDLSDAQLKRDYLNYLKWTEPIALMLALVEDKTQALRVVRLALEVDLTLGARLAGEVKPLLQNQSVQCVSDLKIPLPLKVKFWGDMGSEAAITPLSQALQDEGSIIRMRAVEALGNIGSERAIELLSYALKDEDSTIRMRASEALGNLGSIGAIELLSHALQDEDSFIRSSAAATLGSISSERAIEPLIQALQDEDSFIRSSAAEVLGNLGSIGAIEPLSHALQDINSNVRMRAAEALGKIGSDQAIELLSYALQDEDSFIRSSAVLALGSIGSERTIEPLVQALQDEDSFIRSSAAEVLGNLGSIGAIEPLIQALQDINSNVRWSAAAALIKIGSERAIEPLIQALQDEGSFVRSSAVAALGCIGSERAIEPLIQALQDEDSFVRMRVVAALGCIGSEQAIEPLIQALQDINSSVRGSAVVTLGSISSKEAIEPLIQALQDESSFVRSSAVLALGSIGSEQAIEPLIQALQDINSSVRWSAVVALGKIGSERAIEPLIQALSDQNGSVRGEAAAALGKIGSEKLINPLIQALSDQDDFVRNNAAVALGEIGSERAIEPLIQALSDQDNWIRWSTAAALGKIGSPKPIAQLWQILLQSGDLDLLSSIITIQNRCKFYNYEIAHNLISITQPIALYFSYASEDEEMKIQLEKHLSTLQRQGMITSWSDRQILPGAEVDRVIEEQLNAADVILLLISANSLASDKCYDVEIRKALQRHAAGEAAVIPILLKPVDWQGAVFSRLKVFPSNGVPVTSWQNSDEAFLDIAAGIRSVIQERIKTRG